MKILYITGMLPLERFNGTEIATSEIYSSLIRAFSNVTIAGHLRLNDEASEPPEGMELLDRRAIEFSTASRRSKCLWALTSVARQEPISASKFRGAHARARMQEILSRGFDAVIIDKPQMHFIYSDLLKNEKVSVIWHAIEHMTYCQVADSSKGTQRFVYRREAALSKTLEMRTAARINHAFALSDSDRETLRRMRPGLEVDIIPLTVPPSVRQPEHHKPYDIGLIGNWRWSANADGLKWFCENVVPLVRDDVRISVAGSGAESVIERCERLELLGRVPSASAFVNQCKVLAVPLVSGTGVSMKIIEAAGEGVPTVTTPFGARGIDEIPESISVATSAADFSKKIELALNLDPSVRTSWKAIGASWLAKRSALLDQRLECGISYAAGIAENAA